MQTLNRVNDQSKLSGDLLSILSESERDQLREPESLSEENANALIEAARPMSGRRRDSYFTAMFRQWWVDILYYTGAQSLETFDVLENVDPGLLVDKGHYVANHILRMVQGNVARLSQARADWSVIPNSPDQKDIDGAKYAQHLLDHAYDQLDLERERIHRSLMLDVMGTAFDYISWDPTKGQMRRTYFDPVTQKPVDKSQLMPNQLQLLDQLGSFADTQDGDWEHELLSPFQVLFSPRFHRVEKWPWVLIRRTMTLDQVWDRWPDRAGEIGPDDMSTAGVQNFWGRLAVLAQRPGVGLFGNADHDESVTVDELWYPPSRRCPKGMTIVASRRHILEKGPHRFAEAGIDLRFPVIDNRNLIVPGRFHGMSTVEHLIGPQRDYNRTRQQSIQMRDILATPQWLAPEGSTKRRVMRNEYGDWIEYSPGMGKPELVAPPPLSAMHVESAGAALNDMQIIASFGDASLGQMPQGARSGNAVSALAERDQMGIMPTVRMTERSTELLGQAILKLGWKFMKMPRAVAIYGNTRQADVRYFKGEDLNGNVMVKVRAGSMSPRSKAQNFELITQLTQLGALNIQDPREKRLILETLEVGGADKLWFELDAARRRARIENRMFSRPEPRPDFAFPDVSIFDDHQAHWEEHISFTYTDEYELLPPIRKLYFQAHMQKHAMAAGQAIEAMMMVQQAGGQAGPEARVPGEASQPRDRQQTPGASNPMDTA